MNIRARVTGRKQSTPTVLQAGSTQRDVPEMATFDVAPQSRPPQPAVTCIAVSPAAWLRHVTVLFGEDARRRDAGNRGAHLVHAAADDVAVALHHGVEADLRDIGGILFLRLADLRVLHLGTLEEVGLGGTRHEAGHRDAGSFQLGAQRERERINEGLRPVVDRLIGAGHEAGDRTGEQDASRTTRPHAAADVLDEVQCSGDVGIDDVAAGREVLVEEATAESMAGIGQQGIDRPLSDGLDQLVHALLGGKVRRDRHGLRPEVAKDLRRLRDLGAISGDDEIEAVPGAQLRELEPRCLRMHQ